MKTLQEKIEAIKEGTKFNIPMISLKSKISRVTDKAIELGGGNGWIPKSAIVSFDELILYYLKFYFYGILRLQIKENQSQIHDLS